MTSLDALPTPVPSSVAMTPLTAAHIDAVSDLIDGSRSENTELTYRVGWKSWERFAGKFGYKVFPAAPETIAAWLAALVQEGKSPSTAVTYVRAVTDRHKLAGLPSPLTSSEGLRRTLLGISRLMRDREQKKARALSAGELMRLVGEASQDTSLRALRDRAWWLLATSLGLRYSDSILLERRDVSFVRDKGAVIKIRYSKTDQAGEGVELALASLRPEFKHMDAVLALQDLLAVLPEEEDTPLFQGVFKGTGGWRGTRISNNGLNKAIYELAVRAGVDEHAISLTGRWRSITIQRSYRRISDEEKFSEGLLASDWLQRLVSGD